MDSRTMRLPTAASLVAALSIGLAATAGADTQVKQVQTEVKFLEVDRTTFMQFRGKLDVGAPCKDDRLVTLWYKPNESSPPQKMGTDKTNRKGAFTIELSTLATMGLYAASVKKDIDLDELGDGDFLKFICRTARPIYRHF